MELQQQERQPLARQLALGAGEAERTEEGAPRGALDVSRGAGQGRAGHGCGDTTTAGSGVRLVWGDPGTTASPQLLPASAVQSDPS